MSTLPRSDTADFNWWANDEDIVVQDQAATAVYPNKHGSVVLRQQKAWHEENDSVVIVAREHIVRLVYAMLRAAGHDDTKLYRTNGIACEDVDDPADDVFKPSFNDTEEEPDRDPDEDEIRLIENASKPDATAAGRQKHKSGRDRKTDLATTSDKIGNEIADELFSTEAVT